MKPNSGSELEPVNGSKGAPASLQLTAVLACLPGCADKVAAIASFWTWPRDIWPGIADGSAADPVAEVSASKIQATAADEAEGIGILRGRSEDSALKGRGSNTILQ